MAQGEGLKTFFSRLPIIRWKAIIRGRRLAVEHILGILAVGDTVNTILEGYPWLELEDIQACLAFAHRIVGHERIEPFAITEQTA